MAPEEPYQRATARRSVSTRAEDEGPPPSMPMEGAVLSDITHFTLPAPMPNMVANCTAAYLTAYSAAHEDAPAEIIPPWF